MAQLSIAALVVYPLKSAAGCSVAEAAFTPTGLAFDRTWAAVRAGTGRFISQRVHPKMALISARLSAPELLAGADAEADAALILTAPGAGELRVPLAPAGARALVEASVWGWKGLAADEGDAAAAWLSAFLGVDARLVHYVGVAAGGTADARARRAVKSEFVPAAAAGEVAFADSFPLLVATHASLDALNAEIGGGAALPINRFRPNVLVAGAAPWEEDSWVRLALGGAGGAEGGGGVILEFGQPCDRCVIPTVNQATGAREGDEPTKTLAALRSAKALGWTSSFPAGTVFFGTHFSAPAGAGTARVGDTVAVLERRAGPPVAAA